MKVKIEAFDALACVGIVSEDILLQTLSKKASSVIKDKSYPGQQTSDLFQLPASTVAFAFVHGLEDEFYEVRITSSIALFHFRASEKPKNPCTEKGNIASILLSRAKIFTMTIIFQSACLGNIICERTLSLFLTVQRDFAGTDV